MTHGTIEGTYEYRIANIVKAAFESGELSRIQSGAELEFFMNTHERDLITALLYDIDIYMGFDDLLKQVQS